MKSRAFRPHEADVRKDYQGFADKRLGLIMLALDALATGPHALATHGALVEIHMSNITRGSRFATLRLREIVKGRSVARIR